MTETRCAARQVGQLSGLLLDLDLQHAPAYAEANRLASDELEVADAGQPGLRAHGSLGSLDGERVARAPAVQLEVDAPGQVLVEQEPRVLAADAPEPQALGQADEIAREPVAADVRALPEPARLGLVAQRREQGAAVARAAPVVLAVRADEEERVVDRLACGVEVEVEVEEVLIAAELGAEEP